MLKHEKQLLERVLLLVLSPVSYCLEDVNQMGIERQSLLSNVTSLRRIVNSSLKVL